MFVNNAVSVRPIIVSLILCYLSLLGYHHLQRSQPVEQEEVLASAEFEDEFPEELVSLTASKKPKPIKAASLPKKKSKRFDFKPGTLPKLAPRSLAGDDLYRFYTDQAERLGMRVEGLTVLGFRGLSPEGARHPSGDNASNYDDTFVILNPAQKSVIELLGSTHAGQFTSTLSPDGVAQIKPGRYQAFPCGEYADMPCWLVVTPTGDESVPCRRDANGNGYIDPEEKVGQLRATEILFHNGRYQEYGSSIGCQVLPPDLMERFISEIGRQNSFEYLLIDANQKFR